MARLAKPKTVVCPICWRANCKFFVRIGDLKFTDAERRRFFELFHRDICQSCKRLRCAARSAGQRCVREKHFDAKKKCLPNWAKGKA